MRVDVRFPDGQEQRTALRDGDHTEVRLPDGRVLVRVVCRGEGRVEMHVFPEDLPAETGAPVRMRNVRPL